jgi:hypothetical protein
MTLMATLAQIREASGHTPSLAHPWECVLQTLRMDISGTRGGIQARATTVVEGRLWGMISAARLVQVGQASRITLSVLTTM